MNNRTIADIYETNEKIRAKTKDLAAQLTGEQADFLPEGEKWSVAHIFEHIANVEESMSKISYKLLSDAKDDGKMSDGTAKITANFLAKAQEVREIKLEAPEMVRPKGKMTIAESLAKMEENSQRIEKMRQLFETVDCAAYTFPHPFMGELNAAEWLTLIGGHETRHLAQIGKILGSSAD